MLLLKPLLGFLNDRLITRRLCNGKGKVRPAVHSRHAASTTRRHSAVNSVFCSGRYDLLGLVEQLSVAVPVIKRRTAYRRQLNNVLVPRVNLLEVTVGGSTALGIRHVER